MPKLGQKNQWGQAPLNARSAATVTKIASVMERALKKEERPVPTAKSPAAYKTCMSLAKNIQLVDNVEVHFTGADLDEREAIAGLLYWVLKGSGFSVSINSDLKSLPLSSTTERYDEVSRTHVGVNIHVRRP